MSLQINLSSRELLTVYRNIVEAKGIDWALFKYEGGSNDLKVQSTGDGGLEELVEEFSSGQIQYAFVRVKEPTSKLLKFVQINWCGEQAPLYKKGLFPTHSAAVAGFLKGAHVVISARNQEDVSPSVIMSRVEAASGAKYSTHNEPTRRAEPIGPVGTSYTPVGKVDINALRREAAAKPPVHPQPTTAKPPGVGKQWSRPATTGFQPKYTPPPPVKPSPAPDDDWEPVQAPVKPTPGPPLPTAIRPTPSSPAVVKESPKPAVTSKPTEEDRIGPVGTNWEPVQLPKPKRLINPFENRAQDAVQEQPAKLPGKTGGMTWSERQALAKKQAEEEEARSRASSFKQSPTVAITPKWKAPAAVGLGVGARVATSVGVSTLPSKDDEPEEEDEWEAPAPPAPPPPPVATRPQPPRQPEPEPELEPEPEVAPPPPPPPPPPVLVSQMSMLSVQELEPEFVPPPPPPPPPPAPSFGGAPKGGKGVCATVLYEYEATEDNEMNLVEGELIEEIEKFEGWWSGVGDNGAKSGLFPANYVEEIAPVDEQEPEPEPEPEVAPPPPPPPPPPVAREPSPEPQSEGVTAIAQYDYEAGEENEITFREGDHIVEIEMVSDDWWQGKTADGSVGLFPANYVELQQ